MAEKIKSRRNASLDYWERREKEALKQTRVSEEEFAEKIAQVYKDMRKDINDRINRWYVRYANDSEIDITEAKKRVSKLDIEEYAELAKKYVALSRSQETRAEAFTDEANEQMKIYNLTMKVNRLENLKAQMGLDLCGGFSRLQKNYGEFLTDQMMKEFTRQSGILGMTTTNPRRFRRQMEAIVNGSFHNATFSQRLWNQQDALKGELDRLLTRALIQGLNPRTVAPELKKKFDSSEQAADLLMITELCRVQTEAQKLAFQEFSYDDYTFICNGGACKECEAMNSKHFKVKDMQAGRNAPPMHPRCRCSTAAYMDREAFEKWLEIRNTRTAQEGLQPIRQNDNMNSKERLRQDGENGAIPAEYVGNYDDYEELTISDEEMKNLKKLRELADSGNVEYGMAYFNNKFTDAFSSEENAFVVIPKEYLEAKGVRLYHSHTNDTLLSIKDFKLLLRDNVDMVAVATKNGDVYTASVEYGYRPTEEEFLEDVAEIRTEADRAVMDNPNFWDWSIEQRTYMAIREQAYLIARRYGWRLEGGTL